MAGASKRKLTQILTDALMHQARRECRDPDDQRQMTTQIHLVARSIFRRAIAGDMVAAQLIGDRLEGKAVTPVDISHDHRMTVTLAGLIPRDLSQRPANTVIDATAQAIDLPAPDDTTANADRPAISTGSGRDAASELGEGVTGTAPPTHNSTSPASDARTVTSDDAHAALRARILASLSDG